MRAPPTLLLVASSLCLLGVGCEPEANASSEALAEVAPAEVASAPSAGGEPERQPDGVPFPLPDPLPAVALPRAIEGGEPAAPGPAPVRAWVGGSGTADGRLHYPRAVVAGPGGAVFVADKSGRIQKWSPDGRLLAVVRAPAIGQGRPTGLGIDRAGRLLVADTHYCRVLVYDADLRLLRAFGAPGPAPGQLMLISGAQEGADGRIYTTDYGDLVARVQVWSAVGEHRLAFGSFGDQPGQLRRPMNLAVDDGRDRVYVADAVNHRIAVFDRAGAWVTQLGVRGRAPGELDFPYDVELDAEGHVWVAEFGNQRVSVFSPEGRSLGAWGEAGRALGRLHRPWGLALTAPSSLWVLDSGNDRAYLLDRAAVLGSGAEAGR